MIGAIFLMIICSALSVADFITWNTGWLAYVTGFIFLHSFLYAAGAYIKLNDRIKSLEIQNSTVTDTIKSLERQNSTAAEILKMITGQNNTK